MNVITGFFLLTTSLLLNAEKNNISSNGSLQDQQPIFSFGVLADVQYCDCDPSGTRWYRSSLVRLSEALETFKSANTEFVINMGDLIDRDYESYRPVLGILETSGLQIYHVLGNHDYSVEQKYKRRLPLLRDNKNLYYSFAFDNFRFIFLNGNEISTYSSSSRSVIREANTLIDKLKAEGRENAVDWNGAIGSKQLEWLDNELKAATENNESVFIICHFPVWPENIHNLLNSDAVTGILKKYSNIIAWMNGHNHQGNYGNTNMTHFVTFKGMVETDNSNSYAVVEVYRNKIWIKGSGREKSQILAY